MSTSRLVAAVVVLASLLMTVWRGAPPASASPGGSVVASGRAMASVDFVDASRGWTVGTGGLIATSPDGGGSWSRQSAPTSEQLTSVSAADRSHVWAVGARGTVVATSDGGAHWAAQAAPVDNLLTGVDFPTVSDGYISGWDGSVLVTHDGGATWQALDPGSRSFSFWAIDFVDAQHGWVVGESWDLSGVVFRTADGGATWQKTSLAPQGNYNGLRSVSFVSASEGWAVGDSGYVWHTSDGGATWRQQSSGTTGSLSGVRFANNRTGWAVGNEYNPVVVKTVDGGANWSPAALPAGRTVMSVDAVDATHAWVGAGPAAVLRTRDGWAWTSESLPVDRTASDLLAVAAPDSSHAWAVGRRGVIMASSDGGGKWRFQPSGTTVDLSGVSFADATHGWAAGNNPDTYEVAILKTTDGSNWEAAASFPARVTVHDLVFADREHGFLGTSSGLYTTTDGGATWVGSRANTGPVKRIDFVDSQYGWLTTGTSVWRTTDGGGTWTTAIAYGQFSSSFETVDFVDRSHGWAGGYRTSDGGDTWTRSFFSIPWPAMDLKFVDGQRGWAALSTGQLARTLDGGDNWTAFGPNLGPFGSHPSPYLAVTPRRLALVSDHVGWVVGDVGTITELPSSEAAAVLLEVAPAGSSWTLTSTLVTDWFYDPPTNDQPSGTVKFFDRDTALGTVTVDGAGRASLRVTLDASAHYLTAVYNGNGDFEWRHSVGVSVDLRPGAPPPTTTSSTRPTPPPTTTPTGPTTPTTPTDPAGPPADPGPDQPSSSTTTLTGPGGSAPPADHHTAETRSGYWMLTAAGQIFGFGDAKDLGGARMPDAVDVEPTPTGGGYWIVSANGAVTNRGDAPFLGNAELPRGERAVSLSATPDGTGYWVFTDKGRVLSFGSATFFGDLRAVKLNGPVLGSVATPTGKGYWMVASDGGIFSYGDATFHGSTGSVKLNKPVMAMAPRSDGAGYWLVASDGGIFAFDVPFYGSLGSVRLNQPVSGMVPGKAGYLMVGRDGGIFSFGSVAFHGSLGSKPPPSPVVSVALLPSDARGA